MQRILLLAAFCSVGLICFAQTEKIIDDKNVEKRDVKGFQGIHVSNGIDLYLTGGQEESVAVSASDISIRDRIITVVENGILKIYLDNEEHRGWHNPKMRAYVSYKLLNEIKASGGSDIYVEDVLKADKLDLALSGGSDLKGKVDIGDLAINQSGGSDVNIAGRVVNLSIHGSGGSDLKGYALATDVCQVVNSGGSDVEITVNKELDVMASGGSDVYYKGSCSVKQVKSGGSEVVKKG